MEMKERILKILESMDQKTMRRCNDGSGEDNFNLEQDVELSGMADTIDVWISELRIDDPEYNWTDDDIRDYINGTYPKVVK